MKAVGMTFIVPPRRSYDLRWKMAASSSCVLMTAESGYAPASRCQVLDQAPVVRCFLTEPTL
ncbi:hypothetical protein A6U87_11975 [Rhizobium sp. AC44/96]|nr:hypothetical protein A6U87_11975 [Rhizobium sp. AC44/96]